MSRLPLPNGGLQHSSSSYGGSNTSRPDSPGGPGMSPAMDTRKKQSKRDETTSPATTTLPLPTPPSSTNTTPLLDVPSHSTVPAPLPTPPTSIRSPSPSTNELMPPPPIPFPVSAPVPGPKRSESRRSVQFSPSTSPLPSPNLPIPSPDLSSTRSTSPAADEPRQRYHSNLTRPTVTRSESVSTSKSFTGKLQSLRKKIENELSRKRGPASGQTQTQTQQQSRSSKKAQKGTVAGLRPSPALTVPESMTVADASQLCAAKRTDCVLVVDEEEGLSGIFTAKDLAFRVAAESLDPRITTVAQIMTKNPMVTRDSTSATEALQLMVSRHFRHLPVCNDDGDVVGLLDITKVFHEALAKVERGSTATSQLSAALAGVQSELGPGLASNPQAAAMLAYVDALRDRMAQPDLTSVMDLRTAPPTVTPRTSVRDAARLMKERRTTAVCVMETNSGTSAISGASGGGNGIPRIAGIFTSKDVVLRVIAAGLDAQRCSVVRVMTPHPDTAPPTTTVQDALKKMHNGHYLNLPVVETDGRLVGIVDVLKLTYATLEQIDSMSEEQNPESGPMWGKFFDTLNTAGNDDDTASVVSQSDRPDTPSRPLHHRGLSSVTSPISEVMPNDSASAVDDNASDVGGKPGASSVAPAPLPVDDGTYIFKFRTPSGRTHRFQARHDSFELLKDIVHGKLVNDPFFSSDNVPEGTTMHLPDPATFTLSYTDDEGDSVTMTADGDVADAVRIARGQKSDRVVLLVDGGKVWEDAARDIGGESAVEKLKIIEHEAKAIEKEEAKEEAEEKIADPAHEPTYGQKGTVHSHGPSPGTPGVPELVGGVLPKEMVLPAAIGFLGVVILGVFIASRASK